MMNSRTTVVKYSTYDDCIQTYLVFNIGLQILVCSILATGFVLWLNQNPIYEYLNPGRHDRGVTNWFLNFMSWMLLMT